MYSKKKNNRKKITINDDDVNDDDDVDDDDDGLSNKDVPNVKQSIALPAFFFHHVYTQFMYLT